jgi:RNA polymerase sigma factor (sigma-70 family)
MPNLENLLADYRRDATKINGLLEAVTQLSKRVAQGMDSAQDPEDIAQETAIAIYEYLPSMTEEITPLVVRITRNKLIDEHRRRKIKFPLNTDDTDIISSDLVSQWQRRKVEIATEVLGERVTTLLEHGYTHEEIEELTGVSVNTVRSRIKRARKLFLAA